MRTFTMLTVAGTLACAAPAIADDTTSTTPAPSTTTPTAQEQCRTERTAMTAKVFGDTYGTNAGKSNAFGKCVSKRAAKTETAAAAAKTNAAKECKAEETADTAAFTAKYGTGKKGANAYGKCVSGKAKAKTAATVKTEVKADVNAAKSCKAARKADAAAFATKWGKARNAFGKCVAATAKAAQQPAATTTS
jgi:hypothetical protein